ncbi:MAG: D-aminoacyl-tRNA deacylase [Candidatus Limnocylindria bacterium]
MRAVVQRVRSAAVRVDDREIARIGPGLAVLLGVGRDDRPEDGERLAARVATLRLFNDERGRLQHALADAGGEVLVIPQFTLYGDVRHGRRPDFTRAAEPEAGRRLYDAFCGTLRGLGLAVAMGEFGASMRIALEADGPVTLVVSTDGWAEGEVRRG